MAARIPRESQEEMESGLGYPSKEGGGEGKKVWGAFPCAVQPEPRAQPSQKVDMMVASLVSVGA